MYGLPYEHDAPISDWGELLSHLRAIADSQIAVRVAVTDDPKRQRPYFEARGKLKAAGAWEGRERFVLNTESSREDGGFLLLGSESFRGGHLLTYDGDDYFWLVIEMEAATLQLQDTNSL